MNKTYQRQQKKQNSHGALERTTFPTFPSLPSFSFAWYQPLWTGTPLVDLQRLLHPGSPQLCTYRLSRDHNSPKSPIDALWCAMMRYDMLHPQKNPTVPHENHWTILNICLFVFQDWLKCTLTPGVSASIGTISTINQFDCYLIFWDGMSTCIPNYAQEKACDRWRACSTLESSSPRMSSGHPKEMAGIGGHDPCWADTGGRMAKWIDRCTNW